MYRFAIVFWKEEKCQLKKWLTSSMKFTFVDHLNRFELTSHIEAKPLLSIHLFQLFFCQFSNLFYSFRLIHTRWNVEQLVLHKELDDDKFDLTTIRVNVVVLRWKRLRIVLKENERTFFSQFRRFLPAICFPGNGGTQMNRNLFTNCSWSQSNCLYRRPTDLPPGIFSKTSDEKKKERKDKILPELEFYIR